MISPFDPSSPYADNPMAVQFMTQGQMRHMPQAQYLAPQEFGAFRTTPLQNQAPMPLQKMSAWNAYMVANRGNIFGLTGDYSVDTYNMATDQSLYQTMARRRVHDSVASVAGTGADMLAPAMLGAGIGGPLGLAAGLGVSMAGASVAAPFMDRMRQTRRLQEMSMSGIVSGPDMAGGIGQGFSAPAANRLDRGIRTMAAGDIHFKEDDLRGLLQTANDLDLTAFSGTAAQYEGALGKLKKNVEVMSKVLGSTDFKELGKHMKRLMDMGADLDTHGGLTRQEQMFSRMTGLRHNEMVDTYGSSGAVNYARAGLTGYQGSLSAMGTAASVNMAQKMGILGPGTLSRMGGKTGMSQRLEAEGVQAFKQYDKLLLNYIMNDDMSGINEDKLDEFLSGGVSIKDMTRSVNMRTPEQMAKFLQNMPSMSEDLLNTVGKDQLTVQMARLFGKSAGVSNSPEGLSAMLQQMGYSPESAGFMVQKHGDTDLQGELMRQKEIQARKELIDSLEKERSERGFLNKISRSASEFWQNTGGAMYSDIAENYMRRSQDRENRELGVISYQGDVSFSPTRGYMTERQRLMLRKPDALVDDVFKQKGHVNRPGEYRVTGQGLDTGQSKVASDVARMAVEMGIDPAHALAVADIESGMGKYEDPTNPHMGIFQMGEAAMLSVMGLDSMSDATAEQRTTIKNRADPKINMEYGLKYQKKLMEYLEAEGVDLSKYDPKMKSTLLYMAHNQGARGAAKILRAHETGTPVDAETRKLMMNQSGEFKANNATDFISGISNAFGERYDKYKAGYKTVESTVDWDDESNLAGFLAKSQLNMDGRIAGLQHYGKEYGIDVRALEKSIKDNLKDVDQFSEYNVRAILDGQIRRANPNMSEKEVKRLRDKIWEKEGARFTRLSASIARSNNKSLDFQIRDKALEEFSGMEPFEDLEQLSEAVESKVKDSITYERTGYSKKGTSKKLIDAANTDSRAYNVYGLAALLNENIEAKGTEHSKLVRSQLKHHGGFFGLTEDDLFGENQKSMEAIKKKILENTNLTEAQVNQLFSSGADLSSKVGGKEVVKAAKSAHQLTGDHMFATQQMSENLLHKKFLDAGVKVDDTLSVGSIDSLLEKDSIKQDSVLKYILREARKKALNSGGNIKVSTIAGSEIGQDYLDPTKDVDLSKYTEGEEAWQTKLVTVLEDLEAVLKGTQDIQRDKQIQGDPKSDPNVLFGG